MFRFLHVLAALTWVLASAATAAPHEIRQVALNMPEGWQVTHSIRETEIDFASADGRYQLWARWWFPDEPLLGYPDIVHDEKRVVAGRDALFIHAESAGERVFTLAVLERDAEGEQFLLQLIADSGTVALAEQEAMFDRILAGMTYAGQPAGGSRPEPEASATGTGFDGFSLAVPAGWRSAASGEDLAHVRQGLFVAPDGDHLIWVFAAQPGDGMDALGVIDGVAGLLYGEYLVIKSIENETYPDMAGSTAHAMHFTANAFAIGDAALPFKKARGVVYRGGDADNAFLIVTVAALDAPAAVNDGLDSIARSLGFGGGQGGAADQPVDWLAVVSAHFGQDCFLLDLPTWSHPTRGVLDAARAGIDFVALCKGRTYPVFGVQLPYDPRTATDDYFIPLYDDLLSANGNWTFSLLETRDGTLVEVARSGRSGIEVGIDEIALPASGGTAAVTPQPAAPIAPQPQARAWQPVPLERDGVIDFTALPPVDGAYVLFDGRTIDANWTRLNDSKVDYDAAARLTADGLSVHLPPDSGWGIVGLESARPMVWLDRLGDGASQTVSFHIDRRRTESFVTSLRHGADTLSLMLRHTEDGARLRVMQGRSNRHNYSTVLHDQPAPPIPPARVDFTLRNGRVEIAAEGMETQVIDWTGAQAGNGLDVLAHSEPGAGKWSNGLMLVRITLDVTMPATTSRLRPSDDPADPPLTTLFAADHTEGWVIEPWGDPKGEANAPCTLDATGLHVDAAGQEFRKFGRGCKLHSAAPVFDMGRRVDSGDLAMFLDFDPAATDSLRLVLSPYQEGQNWVRYGGTCEFRLLIPEDAQDADFSVWCGGVDKWHRTVAADWLRTRWSGGMSVLMGKDTVCLGLDEGQQICLPYGPTGKPYLYLLAPDYRHKAAARFALRAIRTQWRPHLAGVAAERWRFLDDGVFDPADFIAETMSDLKELDQ